MTSFTRDAAQITPTLTLGYSRRRVRTGLILTFIGLVVFLIGAKPNLFGLDRSPVIGFVQIAVFEVGLGVICLGGYLSIAALWHSHTRSIPADIGLRLVATGYVIAVFCGMADVFGFGSHNLPGIPYFGHLQQTGVEMGQVMIAIGFLMLIPYTQDRYRRPASTDIGSKPIASNIS